MERLTLDGRWFADAPGRRILLRGVNISGSAKTPSRPPGATHLPQDPSGHRDVSFVGRPLPDDTLDEQFARCARWGFRVVRLLVTWEAVEHAGPGHYDEAYLDGISHIVRRAGVHGLYVFLDPHQDAWSRWSGGDGAPGWTLEAVGFDLARLDASEAAITQHGRPPGRYGPMIWPNNWTRLASATMFGLFLAGDLVAPATTIDGEPAQHYLQRHFLGAMRAIAERLRGLTNVLGWEPMNEPSPGYLTVVDLAAPLPVYGSAARLTGLQSMAIPAGYPASVPVVGLPDLEPVVIGETLLNPAGVNAWRDDRLDPWRRAGVWDVGDDGQPRLLRPDHFAHLDVWSDGLRPFIRAFAAMLREVDPAWLIFVEGEPGAEAALAWDPCAGDPERVVHAAHWYDLATLITKTWDPGRGLVWARPGELVRGESAVRASFAAQLQALTDTTARAFGGGPTMVGEFGVPFDLGAGAHVQALTGHAAATSALAASYDALDAVLAHGTVWNMTPDNSHTHGDGWNGEDLSIWSTDDAALAVDPSHPDAGARALAAFARPYVHAAAGTLLAQTYDHVTGAFQATIRAGPVAAAEPTIVVAPIPAYPAGPLITVSAGRASWRADQGAVAWSHPPAGRYSITLERPAAT